MRRFAAAASVPTALTDAWTIRRARVWNKSSRADLRAAPSRSAFRVRLPSVVTRTTSDKGSAMRTFSSWSLGRKLGTGFGITVAIFLVALGITLYYSASAQSTWKKTLYWQTAEKGIAMQIRSTQIQMTE